MEKADIAKELLDIQLFLEQEPADENIIADFGDRVAVYMTRTSILMAESKYHLDEAMYNATNRASEKGFSPSIMRDYIKSICKDENKLYLTAERLNRACTHRLDWCRTRLSFYKQQMNYK